MQEGAGAGFLLLTPCGEEFKYVVHLDFKATNNMAGYEALIFGLSAIQSLGVWQLLVKGDSQLIIKQVKGECSYNNPQLATYLLHAQKLEKDFEVLDLQHVPHVNNAVTNDLSTKASTWALVPDGVFEKGLPQPTARPTEPVRVRDQHLEAGGPGVPVLMEPAKDLRRHRGLRAPRRARSRC
jgi:ribonuclease HI